MQVIEWEKASRRLSQHEVDSFYERPLDAPTLFRFTTTSIALPPHGGSFSLKLVLSGEEHYEIGPRRITLQPGQLLFINEGERYASRIEKHTESLSIFAPIDEVAPAIESAVNSRVYSLEDHPDTTAQFEIPQISFQLGRKSAAAIRQLVTAIDDSDSIDTQDAMRRLLAEALGELFNTTPPRTIAEIKKRSTRDELRRRILRAKEYIDDVHGHYNNLDDLAAVACLSKYHFLRSFRAIFGLSPAAYARRIRLQHAGRTLAQTGDVIAASRRAGYRDPRAFERAYKRVTGKDLLPGSRKHTKKYP